MNKKFYKLNKELENKRKQKCTICGEDAKCCLQFHHIKDKKYNISQAVRYLNPELFKLELDKCICVELSFQHNRAWQMYLCQIVI